MATPIFDKSIFKNYFDADDAEALAWAENVLAKLKASGLVAEYLQREDEDLGDTDFENYYRPICILFAYVLRLARTFQGFRSNEFLANEFLNQRGQFTCGDETLDELAYAIENAFLIRARRGSIGASSYSTVDGIPDGELLRLFCVDELSFFKMGVCQERFLGWVVDSAGPLYKGNEQRYDLNLGWEDTEDAFDLSKYPLINENSVFLTRYRGKRCIEIEASTLFSEAGIGADIIEKRILVDPRLDIAISFEIAQDITNENISFRCLAFDAGGNQINLLDTVTGTPRNYFFETRRLNQAGVFYQVTGILFNKDRGSLSADEARLNIGFGHHLMMPANIAYIVPQVIYDNEPSDDSDVEQDNFDSASLSIDLGTSSDSPYNFYPSLFIWNFKVTPLKLDYERCIVGGPKSIDIIADNKNGNYSNDNLRMLLRKYFIPYNQFCDISFLDELGGGGIGADNFILAEDNTFVLLEDGNKIELE